MMPIKTHTEPKTHSRGFIKLAERLGFLIRSKLWLQILVSMVLGVTIGLLISPNGMAIVSKESATIITDWLVLPGHIFLALIQMIMLPLVVSSIVLGLAGTQDLDTLRKMGLRVAPYFIFTTTIAVILGVALATIIEPGQYIDTQTLLRNIPSETLSMVKTNDVLELTLHERIVGLIPANPLRAAINESMLQLVILSMFIGVAIVLLKPAQAKPLVELARSVRALSMIIVGWAMLLAPLAVLGLLAQITMQVGIDAIIGISIYIGTVIAGLLLLISLYLLLVWSVGKMNPFTFLSKIRELQLLAFSTSSSAAVMPLSIETAEKKLNIRPSTSNFLIPLGATINMDGTALYQVVAAIFLTQAFGIDLSSGELLLLIATTIGASIGAPSTPGVGIVILATILTNIGVPASGIALIIGVDRILDMSRTVINVTGDLTACIVIDKWLFKNGSV